MTHGEKISLGKIGVPMSARNREALRPYWESKKGVPSKKRNGRNIICEFCGSEAYKSKSRLERVKNHFCSRRCAYNFKDEGKTTEYKKIRKSDKYRLWREDVFRRDNWTCVECGARGQLHADHIKAFSLYPELRFELTNGRTLCIPCHQKTDNYGARAIKHLSTTPPNVEISSGIIHP